MIAHFGLIVRPSGRDCDRATLNKHVEQTLRGLGRRGLGDHFDASVGMLQVDLVHEVPEVPTQSATTRLAV